MAALCACARRSAVLKSFPSTEARPDVPHQQRSLYLGIACPHLEAVGGGRQAGVLGRQPLVDCRQLGRLCLCQLPLLLRRLEVPLDVLPSAVGTGRDRRWRVSALVTRHKWH